MALRVRPMTGDEVATIERWRRSRTESARRVERAAIIWAATRGQRAPAIARDLGLAPETVRRWLKRFNPHGLDGLEDQPRSGRPATYTPAEIGLVSEAALTDPQALGRPFGSWTRDRLAAYLNEEQGGAIKRARIAEVPIAEGLRWQQQETRFGERVDPAFAEKRGPSSPSPPSRRRTA
jgi:transposase